MFHLVLALVSDSFRLLDSTVGEIHSDTDDHIDIDSNTEERSIITKESAMKQKQNYATDDETHNIKGKVIIHEFIEKYFKKYFS